MSTSSFFRLALVIVSLYFINFIKQISTSLKIILVIVDINFTIVKRLKLYELTLKFDISYFYILLFYFCLQKLK